jgi:hypothetical protein
MAQTTVTMKCNADKLIEAMSELKLYVDGLSTDRRQRLVQFLFDGDNFTSKFISTEARPAPDLWTQVVFFEPSDLFLDLLAALRTGDLDNFFVKIECHDLTSHGSALTCGIDVQKNGFSIGFHKNSNAKV